MRVFQRDMTPYKTIDPFGNEVSFRPELRSDVGGIMAYHSTEGELLSIVLKYVEQRGLKPATLEDNARSTLEWAETLGQGGGTCSEHFGGHDVSALMFFTGWDIPFAKLGKDNTTLKRSIDGIVTESHGAYFAYLDNDNNLAFAYEPREKPSVPEKEVCAVYSPEDVDHLIKGLLYQSAKGLGRTSCRQLRGILECRFSEEFQREVVNHERDTWKVVKV